MFTTKRKEMVAILENQITMKLETKLKGVIVLLTLTLLWMTVMWNNDTSTIEEQKSTINELGMRNDSLHDELFIMSIEVGRHELTRDFFFDKHKNLQLEYENYLNHETE
jgi:hypothetical protein